MKWIEALKVWNGKKGGPWCIPRKGSAEYDAVREIMARAKPAAVAARNTATQAKALEQLRGVEAATKARNEERKKKTVKDSGIPTIALLPSELQKIAKKALSDDGSWDTSNTRAYGYVHPLKTVIDSMRNEFKKSRPGKSELESYEKKVKEWLEKNSVEAVNFLGEKQKSISIDELQKLFKVSGSGRCGGSVEKLSEDNEDQLTQLAEMLNAVGVNPNNEAEVRAAAGNLTGEELRYLRQEMRRIRFGIARRRPVGRGGASMLKRLASENPFLARAFGGLHGGMDPDDEMRVRPAPRPPAPQGRRRLNALVDEEFDIDPEDAETVADETEEEDYAELLKKVLAGVVEYGAARKIKYTTVKKLKKAMADVDDEDKERYAEMLELELEKRGIEVRD
jgi:hypothetical protein